MKSVRLFAALAAAFLLSGFTSCATLDGALENRLTMTAACDQVRADSQWGPVGISSKIADQDAKPVLQALCGARAPASAAR
jgi:hypothetical protein